MHVHRAMIEGYKSGWHAWINGAFSQYAILCRLRVILCFTDGDILQISLNVICLTCYMHYFTTESVFWNKGEDPGLKSV